MPKASAEFTEHRAVASHETPDGEAGTSRRRQFTDVILAFYNRETNDLLLTAEGRYGLGLDIQMDVNGALKKALEQIPEK